MSVIYDALNKLKKSKGDTKEEMPPDLSSASNVIVFDDLLKKHAVTTYSLIALLIIGVGSMLYLLHQYDVTHQIRPYQAPIQTSIASPEETTPAPDVVPATPADPETMEVTVAHIKLESIPAEPEQFPEEEPATALAFATYAPEPQNETSQVPTPVQHQHELLHPAKTGQPLFQPEQELVSRPAEELFIPEENANPFSPPPASLPKRPEETASAPTPEQSAPTSPLKRSPEKTKDVRNVVDFSPVIHTLNNELHQSILLKDYAKGEEILHEIEGLLGAQSNYVLNLKAYFHIQNNDMDKAKQVLQQLLSKNKTDLDAGLNMIVVLCQQDQLKPARKQVRFMLDYYPANPALLHFKQQLGE